MNIHSAQHIVFLLLILVLSGCTRTRFDVTVQDQMGQTIDQRILKTKDLPVLMDDIYSSLGQGCYEKCRGLADAVKEIWPSELEANSKASRLSAWATLFEYQENPTSLTSLENEKRNLLILHEASAEFAEVKDHWIKEAKVVRKAIDARLLNRSAFNSFVKAMRASTMDSQINQNGRIEMLARVANEYPDWSRFVELGSLADYPWREIAK